MTAPQVQVGYGTSRCGVWVLDVHVGSNDADGNPIPVVDGMCTKKPTATVWCAFSPALSASLCPAHLAALKEHNPAWIDHTTKIKAV